MINLFHRYAEPFAPDATPFVADAAADDLGLRITPFEQAYDINVDVKIEVDDSLFTRRLSKPSSGHVS